MFYRKLFPELGCHVSLFYTGCNFLFVYLCTYFILIYTVMIAVFYFVTFSLTSQSVIFKSRQITTLSKVNGNQSFLIKDLRDRTRLFSFFLSFSFIIYSIKVSDKFSNNLKMLRKGIHFLPWANWVTAEVLSNNINFIMVASIVMNAISNVYVVIVKRKTPVIIQES